MNVGIVTIHNHFNYGAVLQAYALNRVVRDMGHSCRTINCSMDPGHGRLQEKTGRPGAYVTKAYNLLNWLANKRNSQRFLRFIHEQIPLSDIEYSHLDQMEKEPLPFDVFITGSDQVWRPRFLDRDMGVIYHLGFVSPGKARLVSYAPSFGVKDIPSDYSERIAGYLKRYHHLSVREIRGQQIIKEISGREAHLVLDPTLLLTEREYDDILEKPGISGGYILVYPMELGDNMAFYRLVEQTAIQTGLPVVCVMPLNYDFRWLKLADKVLLDAGPCEFLGLIKHATIVCTNSFHGTVFSILFRKSFIGIPHTISNSRLQTLLELVDLQSRQLTDLVPETIKAAIDTEIDYETLGCKLRKHVDDSVSYLKTALGDAHN